MLGCYTDVITTRFGVEYPVIIKNFLKYGSTVKSRVGETKEILNYRLTLTSPRHCIVDREGFSEDFMNEEILQILAGRYDEGRLRVITPRAADLITKVTAYGPRTWEQLQYVAEELQNTPESRRAVVYVGRYDDLQALRDGATDRAGEMPCTMTWQFFVRDDKLHMTVNMRSLDVVWGLVYDIPSFVAVQMTVARHLKLPLGEYVHNAGSAHIYDRHYDLKSHPNDAELSVPFIKNTVGETRKAALELMKKT